MTILDRFRIDDRVAIVTGASSGLGVDFAVAQPVTFTTFADERVCGVLLSPNVAHATGSAALRGRRKQ